MKTLCKMLVCGLLLSVSAARGDDAPPAAQDADKSEKGVDVNVLGGIRVRVGKPGNDSKGVRVDAPGVRVRVGAGKNAEQPAVTEKQSYIGLFADPVPEALAAQLGEVLGKGEGLLVVEVLAGSPAEKAGLKPGDVILAVDEKSTLECSISQFIVHVKTREDPKMNLIVNYI